MTQSEGLLFALERDDEFKQALQEKQDGLRFYKVYKALARLESYNDIPIAWSDKIILCVIASYSEDKKGCFLTNSQFATELGISERNVAYTIKKLAILGLITVFKRTNPNVKAYTPLRILSTNVKNITASLKESDSKCIDEIQTFPSIDTLKKKSNKKGAKQ